MKSMDRLNPIIIRNVEVLSKLRHRLLVVTAITFVVVLSPQFSAFPLWLIWALVLWGAVVMVLFVVGCVRYLMVQHSVIRQGTDGLFWGEFTMPPDRAEAERALYGGVEGGCYVLGFGSPSGEPLWVTDSEVKRHLLVLGESRRVEVLEGITVQHLIKGRGGVVFIDESPRSAQGELVVISGLVGRTEDLRILGGDSLQYDPFGVRQIAPVIGKKLADSLDIVLSAAEVEVIVNGITLLDGTGLKWRLSDLTWLFEDGMTSEATGEVLARVSGNQSLVERADEFLTSVSNVLGESRAKEIAMAIRKVEKVLQAYNAGAQGKSSTSLANGVRSGAVVYAPINSTEDYAGALLKIIKADLESSFVDAAIKKVGHGQALVVINSTQFEVSEKLLEAAPRGRCIIVCGRSALEEGLEKLFGTVIRLGSEELEASFMDTATEACRSGNPIYFETNIPELWDSRDLVPDQGSCNAEQLELAARASSLGASREANKVVRGAKR